MNMKKWVKQNIPELSGRVIIVTGGNSGLGYESLKAFASKGAELIMTARTMEKGESARESIVRDFPEADISVMILDLSDLTSVKAFAESFRAKYDRLDVLLNNAGIMITPYFLTKDGFEGQMGINHLGHFALTLRLRDIIKNTSGARVVNVSSNAHKMGRMDFDNFLFEGGKSYSPMKSYSRSKLANLLFTYELQRRFEANAMDAMAIAAHPGTSQTNLDRYIKSKFFYRLLYPLISALSQDAEMGALPQIRAAADPDAKGGEYYGPSGLGEIKGYPERTRSSRASYSVEDARKLWELSEKLTGVKW